jgi:glutamate-ammonia-ligase adenylyltransferase
MSIAARMTRCPEAFDAARGADVAALYGDLPAEIRALIAGAAGCSPFLAGLLGRESDWIAGATDDPEAALATILALQADPPGPELRRARRRLAALVALCDLGGVWPLEMVTQALTDFADRAVAQALAHEVAAEARRGNLPGLTEADAETGTGLVAMAMGKMGACELNYSSDIDLICLFDETRFSRADFAQARTALVKVVRRAMATLSDVTPEGYVFRTDLRLRPDAAVTPVCMAMAAAEQYYEAEGRTWERAAWIKARPCAGDIAAGERFCQTMRPFVWRRHLDFAAIQDAHDMRLRIRDHKRLGGAFSLYGHDIKLGRGGIREIEFFTQTRQLIAGGRDATLRVRGTVEGLARLAAAGWIPEDVAARLTAHYCAHREVEHRVQMVGDAQTHDLPGDEDGFARLAAFMGTGVTTLKAELTARIAEVHDLTEGFFAPGKVAPLEDDFGAEETSRWLKYPALRSGRASETFRRVKPMILRHLRDAARPDEALREFDAFLAGLPAGVQVFALFEANPQLALLIADIAATAPALARYLGRNAGVLDAVIAGRFFEPWPGVAGLGAALGATLEGVEGYEARLNAIRRFRKEWHFRTGVHHLRGLIGADEAGQQYADLAGAVLAGLWPEVVAEFAARHGRPPGRGAVVVGMGSLGAERLTATSDLDLLVIYDPGSAEMSQGPRSLAVRPYYARLTQALVTALTAPTAEGTLYEVDMRLRPSGRQGPVAASLASFTAYQRDEAWTWEHLALTRARPVAGEAELTAAVEEFRVALLREKAAGRDVRRDVSEMRARIAEAKPPDGPWEAKLGPGRLMEIELCAQTLALLSGSAARRLGAQVAAGRRAGHVGATGAEVLVGAARLFWQVQAAARLLTGGTLDPEAVGEGGRRFLLRETGFADIAALQAAMAAEAVAATAVIGEVLAEDRA